MKRHFRLAAVLLSALVAQPLFASNCSWTTAPANIDLGTYSVFNPVALSAKSDFIIKCTPNTTGTITLNRGANSLSYTPRTLKLVGGSATDLVNYNLFTDAATSLIWGDGTGGSTTYAQFNSTPGDKSFADSIYGAMPVLMATADPLPGTYKDTVTATLSWGSGQPDPRQFTIQAIIQPECKVNTFTLSFGTYDPLVVNAATPLDASTLINVYCTRTTPATVSLDNGSNLSAGTRRLKSGASFLNYDIFKDATHGTVWNTANINGGTSTSRFTALGPGSGGFTAYGRVIAGQDVTTGTYYDTVQATVNY